MTVTIDEISTRVRIALHLEARPSPLLEHAPETMEHERLVRSAIVPAVRRLAQRLQPERFGGSCSDFSDAPVVWHTGESQGADAYAAGHVVLPRRFFRLVAFRMSDWRQTVYSATTAGDATGILLGSKYGGVSGSPWRPRCHIAPYGGGKVLEFRGCADTDAHIAEALYYADPCIDADGGIQLPDGTLEELVEDIAQTIKKQQTK